MSGWWATVEVHAPCPGCRHLAVWRGHKDNVGGTGTTYDGIDCVRCDATWTLRAQLARRTQPMEAAA